MNFYEILEIPQDATKTEVRKSYLKLVSKYHPDKNNGDTTSKFIKIKLAYDTLYDDEKRKEYNNHLNNSEFMNYVDDLFSMDFDLFNNPEVYNVFVSQIKTKNTFLDSLLKDFLKKITHSKPNINVFKNLLNNVLPEKFLNTIKKLNVQKQPLNIKIGLKVNLKDIYNKQILPVKINRLIDGNIVEANYKIKSWILQQTFKEHGNKYDNKIGNLLINIYDEDFDGFKRINQHDLLYEKKINFYDCLNGFCFKLKLLDETYVNIEKSKAKDGEEIIIKNKGLFNEKRNKRGKLFVKFNLDYPNLSDVNLKKLKNIIKL